MAQDLKEQSASYMMSRENSRLVDARQVPEEEAVDEPEVVAADMVSVIASAIDRFANNPKKQLG